MTSGFVENVASGGPTFASKLSEATTSARAVDIAVSYLQMSGWFLIEQALERVRGTAIRILTTDQMNVTQPAVLRAAIRRGIRVKCYRGSRVFHPKVYIIHGRRATGDVAFLGSANISASGLEQGIEAGIRVSEPRLFRRLARWFSVLFSDPDTENVDEAFVADYEKRWKKTAQTRVSLRRAVSGAKRGRITLSPVDAEVLEDVFSSIRLPVATLGLDHAGNNVRNVARLIDVLKRYPSVGGKEYSELHLLGFIHGGKLSRLGQSAKRCRSADAVVKLWTSWIKRTSDADLTGVNPRLTSFKHAADRFWRLKADVRSYFLREQTNPDERETLQTIELCCSGSDVVESLSLSDFRAMAPSIVSASGVTAFMKRAIADYRDNKGSRSWSSNDRRVVLKAW